MSIDLYQRYELLDAVLRDELSKRNLRYVGTRGPRESKLWVVGEAPGSDEDQIGLPFVGASGKEQDRMLEEAGADATAICFTNPYKTRPPNNDFDQLASLGIPLPVFENQFFAELELYKPAIIVTAGKVPTNLLCPETAKLRRGKVDDAFGKWRGSLLISPKLDWEHYIVPIYHPAFILRQWAERVTSVHIYNRAWDEYIFWSRVGHLRALPERELIAVPSYGDVVGYLLECLNDRNPKNLVSIDIENLWSRKHNLSFLYTVGIARSPRSAMSFPVWDYPGDQFVEIWRLLDKILRSRPQIGQNYLGHDAHWFETLGLKVNTDLVEDTMVRHHVLWPEASHKLEYQTLQYCRQPYYKDDGKQWGVGSPKKDLCIYNAMDAAVTYEIFVEQELEFKNLL